MNQRCKGCKYPLTWAEQRKQFWRVAKRIDEDAAKAMNPRCQKCMTKALRAYDMLVELLGDGYLVLPEKDRFFVQAADGKPIDWIPAEINGIPISTGTILPPMPV